MKKILLFIVTISCLFFLSSCNRYNVKMYDEVDKKEWVNDEYVSIYLTQEFLDNNLVYGSYLGKKRIGEYDIELSEAK